MLEVNNEYQSRSLIFIFKVDNDLLSCHGNISLWLDNVLSNYDLSLQIHVLHMYILIAVEFV